MIANIDKLTYLLDDSKKCATVTKSLVPYSGDVVIPDTVEFNGTVYAVTDILDEAFAECVMLRSVVFGENVESIGISAFEGCTMLSHVKFALAMHVDTDEANAFAGDSKPTGTLLKLFGGQAYNLQEWAEEIQMGIHRM